MREIVRAVPGDIVLASCAGEEDLKRRSINIVRYGYCDTVTPFAKVAFDHAPSLQIVKREEEHGYS